MVGISKFDMHAITNYDLSVSWVGILSGYGGWVDFFHGEKRSAKTWETF